MTGFVGTNQLLINCNDIDRAKIDAITQKATAAGIEHTSCANVRGPVVLTDYNSIADLQKAAEAAPKVIGPDGQLTVDTRGYNEVLRQVNKDLGETLKQSGLQEAITDATLNVPAGREIKIKLDGLRR